MHVMQRKAEEDLEREMFKARIDAMEGFSYEDARLMMEAAKKIVCKYENKLMECMFLTTVTSHFL